MAEADDKALVAQILSSYLSNNSVSPADLPAVIETVKRSFGGGGEALPLASSDAQDKKWEPAVSVKKSVTPEAVVCLCCGAKFKALKRHLAAEHHLTPAFRAGEVPRPRPQGRSESARAEKDRSAKGRDKESCGVARRFSPQ
jgi:predicted transcriptional regulator